MFIASTRLETFVGDTLAEIDNGSWFSDSRLNATVPVVEKLLIKTDVLFFATSPKSLKTSLILFDTNPAEAPAGIVNDGVAPLDMLASIE